jgi:hypothetical protein
MHHLLSGGVHADVANIMGSLLPIEAPISTSGPVVSYGLGRTTLWRTMAVILMSTFTARCSYAAWLGRPVPAEARRLHLHHIELAGCKALGLPTRMGV